MKIATAADRMRELVLLSLVQGTIESLAGIRKSLPVNAGTTEALGLIDGLIDKLRNDEKSAAPRLFDGTWAHLFEGNTETECRVLVDVRDEKLIAAQARTGHTWRSLKWDELVDLADSLFNANDVAADPEEHGLEVTVSMPDWAPTDIVFMPTPAVRPMDLSGHEAFKSIRHARSVYPGIATGDWVAVRAADVEGLVVVDSTGVAFGKGIGQESPLFDYETLQFGPMVLKHAHSMVREYRLEASFTGDVGLYDEARMSVHKGEDCVADVLVGLSESGELRVMLTTDAMGDGDHSVEIFPLRPHDDAVAVKANI
ncbi:hypothetical protein [Paraburkholderia sp. SIMBA_054]|uniref:hypothetical protein n=1 Tax=Paraburkholderia sp. SIMBA_054 TaxID=3085795 RepID=UPI0039788424